MAGIKPLALPAFAGIRNDRPAEQFDAADLVAAINVDLSDEGRLHRREGYLTRLVATGAHSLWSDGQVAAFAAGKNLMRLEPSLTEIETLYGGLTPDAPLAFVKTAGRIYWSNGAESGVLDADARANRSWGLVVPPRVTALPTGGELPPGRYGVTVTYVGADGQESGAPESVLVDLPNGGGIDLYLVPSEDARVVGQRVYLTTPNGDVLYYAGALAADVAHVVVSLDVTQLHTPLQTLLMGPCPGGWPIGAYRGRMYVARGRLILYSEAFAPELFDLRRYLEFPSDVRLIAPVEDGLYVSDAEALYWVGGTGPDDFAVRALANTKPAVRGMPAYAALSDFIPDAASDQQAALWLATDGPAAGLPGGVVRTLNNKWRFDAPGSVAQAFIKRPGRPYQFLASLLGG